MYVEVPEEEAPPPVPEVDPNLNVDEATQELVCGEFETSPAFDVETGLEFCPEPIDEAPFDEEAQTYLCPDLVPAFIDYVTKAYFCYDYDPTIIIIEEGQYTCVEGEVVLDLATHTLDCFIEEPVPVIIIPEEPEPSVFECPYEADPILNPFTRDQMVAMRISAIHKSDLLLEE